MPDLSSPIQSHKAELHALCRTYGVERLELFGSSTSEVFDAASSDLDFIVQFADTSPGYAAATSTLPRRWRRCPAAPSIW